MSKLGENADRILEKLNEGGKLDDLKEMPTDEAVLGFMEQCGLIKLRNGELRITDFGLNLLTVG